MPDDAWTQLAVRCEAASGPDREIDARVWQQCMPELEILFDPGSIRPRRHATYGRLADFSMDGWGDAEGMAVHVGAPRLTASVDAVLALIETLPAIQSFAPGSPASSGWKIGLYRGMTPTGQPHAMWNGMVRQHGKENDTNAATPALALCAAYCRARAAQLTSEANL